MKIFGLTGGIACGKSTVSALLEKRGAKVIDADQIARDVVKPGMPAYEDIVAEFGRGILAPDGTLDRPALGKIVFADAGARKTLNSITHPRIAEETGKRLQQLRAAGEPFAIYDAALLVETGGYKMYAALIVVAAGAEVQTERLMARDGISREDALQKIAAQLPLEKKIEVADFVIWNDGSLEELDEKVEKLWEELVERAR